MVNFRSRLMTAIVDASWVLVRQAVAGWLQGGLTMLRVWQGRCRTRRALERLEFFRLADIGLTEAVRRRECAKRFWQA